MAGLTFSSGCAVDSREQALSIGNLDLELIDNLAQRLMNLGILLEIVLKLIEDLGVDHSRRHFEGCGLLDGRMSEIRGLGEKYFTPYLKG
jgi:hypothetical protein